MCLHFLCANNTTTQTVTSWSGHRFLHSGRRLVWCEAESVIILIYHNSGIVQKRETGNTPPKPSTLYRHNKVRWPIFRYIEGMKEETTAKEKKIKKKKGEKKRNVTLLWKQHSNQSLLLQNNTRKQKEKENDEKWQKRGKVGKWEMSVASRAVRRKTTRWKSLLKMHSA